ncbi:MAG TPA: SDR family oxidoreductase [Catalimonadaceae bacterium]|nr:SDR family oxidoreductase [Catalimonadaceae bacterium]
MKLMLPTGTFAGKTILITGGGSGLGLSMAEGLLKLGAQVAIASRNEEKLRTAADSLIQKTGGKVLVFGVDVRDAEAVDRVVQNIFDEAGYLDGVINNAAGNFISPTERLSPNAFSSIIDIVLKGSVHTSLSAGRRWIEKGRGGVFLNIVTTYASTGSAFVVPSAAAKAGVLALTRSLAVEWAPHGIRSNAIAPGPFPTEGAWSRLFPKEAMPKELAEKMDPAHRIPVGRVGDHEELVNLASYLLSDFAGFMNGEVVTLDGGEWLQGAGEFNWLTGLPKPYWDAIEATIRSKKG